MPIQSATPIHDPLRPAIYNDPRQLPNNISETEPTSRLHDLAKHFRPVGRPSAVGAGKSESEGFRKNHKVSEIELLATRCGDTVTRLDAGELGWIDLIRELPKLGCVTALTRNRHAVHKKTGTYRNGSYMDGGSCGTPRLRSSLRSPHLSLLPGAQESQEGRSNVSCVRDTRPSVDSAGWQSGFAVVEEINVGQHLILRRGLQFFDAAGTVVHKVSLMENSNHDAYEALISRLSNGPPLFPNPSDSSVTVILILILILRDCALTGTRYVMPVM